MGELGRPRPAILRALGKHDPPPIVEVEGRVFLRERIFKHDSWAATALYFSECGKRIVCKFNRIQPILGCPMQWLGKLLARRESRHLQLLRDVALVPNDCGPVCVRGQLVRHAVAHVYVPGRPLRRNERLGGAFCDELRALLQMVHNRHMAYIDLHKCENILVGEDGKPYLIDFQVSIAMTSPLAQRLWPTRFVLSQMQAADRYHLCKHFCAIAPNQFGEPTERDRPWWIRLHRLIAKPLRSIRRRFLVLLGVRKGNGRVESEYFAEDAFHSDRNAANSPAN